MPIKQRKERIVWLWYDLGTINSFPTSASGMIVLFKNVNKKKKKSVSFDKKNKKTKKKTNQPTNQNDDAHASSDLVCMIVAVVVQPINNLQLI